MSDYRLVKRNDEYVLQGLYLQNLPIGGLICGPSTAGYSNTVWQDIPTIIEQSQPKSEQLKPCPFCGDIYPVVRPITVNDVLADALVECDCGAVVFAETLEDAILTWNTRA